MPSPRSTKRKVLLVEGPGDREVIYQFCNVTRIDNLEHFDVEAAKGYEKLRLGLAARLKTDIDVIGVLIDADGSSPAERRVDRWQSIRALLEPHYPSIPDKLSAGGAVLAEHGRWPRVGVWIMPDNQRAGMLEDFLLALVPDDDVLLPHARAVVDSLPERRFTDVHRAKASIHTWLAWQEEPGTPLGLAFTRKYLAQLPQFRTNFGFFRELAARK